MNFKEQGETLKITFGNRIIEPYVQDSFDLLKKYLQYKFIGDASAGIKLIINGTRVRDDNTYKSVLKTAHDSRKNLVGTLEINIKDKSKEELIKFIGEIAEQKFQEAQDEILNLLNFKLSIINQKINEIKNLLSQSQ